MKSNIDRYQAQVEPQPCKRQHHKHHGRSYLCSAEGVCWFCGQNVEKGEEMGVLTSDAGLEYEGETGELRPAQLQFGVDVPTVSKRRDQDEAAMNEATFNRVYWRLEEGDSLSARVKDGKWIVKQVSAWRAEA